MKQGYVIALSSVPPRFDGLGPVLTALLGQRPAPERVILCVADNYARFPGPAVLPVLPSGVEVMRGPDIGPGMKAVLPARGLAGSGLRLIYCDDDWIAGPDWAAHLLAVSPGEAATGQGFNVNRLGRRGAANDGFCDIAQGFSGVSVAPEWLSGAVPPEDSAARMVDDIWLSGHLAAQGVAIRQVPRARAALTPVAEDRHGLQDAIIGGQDRAGANRRCATLMHERWGIWP